MRTQILAKWHRLATALGIVMLPCPIVAAQEAEHETKTTVEIELVDENADELAEAKAIQSAESDEEQASKTPDVSQIASPSHRQSKVLYPELNGKQLQLHSFCVSADGIVLAVCAGPTEELKVSTADAEDSNLLTYLIAFQSDGTQRLVTELPFAATAIASAPDQSIFVAGDGQVAHLSADGKVLKVSDAPNMGDKDEMLAEAKKTAEARTEQYTKIYDQQIKMIEERITALKEKDPEDLTRADKSRLTAFQSQLETMQDVIKQLTFSAESVLAGGKRVTAIAANSQDVYVSCGSISGAGYSIWRINHQLEEPKELISSISGCCGQMDVQCCDDGFVLAENTSFKVGIYDRDGQPVNSFGKGDRSSVDGFGSCCNPMNVYAIGQDRILTAESSVGHIKCFDRAGNFVTYVGKAKIGGGCKHCSLGYDPKSDQYYMMHEDANSICVLANSNKLPEMTDEEKALAELRTEFQGKLLGKWEFQAAKTVEKIDAEEAEETQSILYFKQLEFANDGSLKTQGGIYSGIDGDWAWEVAGKTGKGELKVSIIQDQAEMLSLLMDFQNENTARVQFGDGYSSQNATWLAAKRIANCDGEACNSDTCDDPSKGKPTDTTDSDSSDTDK